MNASNIVLYQKLKILKFILLPGVLLLHALNSFPQSGVEKPDSLKREIIKAQADTIPTAKPAEKQYLEASVIYPARDSMVMSYADNKIKMYGEAKVSYTDFEIKAGFIEIDIDKKELYASGLTDSLGQVTGKPEFKQGEENFKATEVRYNFETQKAWVTDVVMEQDMGGEKGQLHSGITKRFPDGTVNLKNGKFTTCDAEHPHFYFAITKGSMQPEKSIVSGPAYLVIEDIPLYFIGLPFGYFPQKRQKTSGLIMPQPGFEANRGYYVRNGGWYFAINDNLDLKLTGDIYSKGSWKTSAATNYAKRYKFRGAFDFSYAKNATGEKDLRDYEGLYKSATDFSVRWSHNQDPKANPYSTFNANVNLSTSSFDKYNSAIDNTAAYLTNTKSSSISYNRKFANPLFNFTAKLGHSQNSRDSSLVLNLPNVSFTVGRFYPFKRKVRVGKQRWYEKIDMRYTSSMENKVYAHENQVFTKDFADSLPTVLDNMKNGFKHEIPMTATFKIIPNMNFTPSLTYQGMLYLYSTQKEWDPDEQEVIESRLHQARYVQSLSPNVNLTYNPQLFGFYTFKRGPVNVIRHMVKPSLSFSYRPDLGYDDSKYYDSYVMDTIGTKKTYNIFEDGLYSLPNVAGQYGNVNFSLGNTFEMKVPDKADSTGQKLKKVMLIDNLGINTSYDVFKDSMNLSDFRLTARTRILNNININFSSVFDPYEWVETNEGKSQRQTPQFALSGSGIPARLNNATLSVGFSLPMKLKKDAGSGSKKNFYTENGSNYGLPWDVKLDYSLRYVKRNPFVASEVTQTLRFSGSLRFSEQWLFRFNSGYDLEAKELTYTTLTVARELHCWQMMFNIIPFGPRKSYTFTLQVKSNMFKDVKYRKEKSWFDSEDFF